MESDERYFNRTPAVSAVGGYGSGFYSDDSPSATVTCDEFFALLNRTYPKPNTIQTALEILKLNKPRYFSNYSLLHGSRSMHESSYENPRAMVYGGNGQMVVTFNGDPSQRGYGQLELMCFNTRASTFEFREVTFPQETAKDEMEGLSAIQKSQAFVISPVHGWPTRDCRQCHQTPARPNWDSYPIWPSAFGGIDDILFQEKRMRRLGTESFDKKYIDAEKAALERFTRKGRYAVLQDNAVDRPNLAAGRIFTDLNARRIVAELRRLGTGFERMKVAFAQALYCPAEGLEYKKFLIRDEVRSSEVEVHFNVLTLPIDPEVKKISLDSGLYTETQLHRLKSNFKLNESSKYFEPTSLGKKVIQYYRSIGFNERDAAFVWGSNVETSIRLANISKLVKPFGIDVQNWSMIVNGGYEFEDGRSNVIYGSAFEQALDRPFLATFFPEDKTLYELVQQRRGNLGNGIRDRVQVAKDQIEICRHLQEKY